MSVWKKKSKSVTNLVWSIHLEIPDKEKEGNERKGNFINYFIVPWDLCLGEGVVLNWWCITPFAFILLTKSYILHVLYSILHLLYHIYVLIKDMKLSYHIDIIDEFCSTYVLSRKRKMLLIIIYSKKYISTFFIERIFRIVGDVLVIILGTEVKYCMINDRHIIFFAIESFTYPYTCFTYA